MANCIINKGMKRPCKVTGGIYTYYVANYPSGATNNASMVEMDNAGVVTGFTAAVTAETFYSYVPNKSSAAYVEEYQVDTKNGTYGFAKKAEGLFAGLSGEKQLIVSELMGADLLVLIKDKNNKIFLMGLDNGAYLGGGSANSGMALNDASGYNLTFSEESGTASPEVSESAFDTLTTD